MHSASILFIRASVFGPFHLWLCFFGGRGFSLVLILNADGTRNPVHSRSNSMKTIVNHMKLVVDFCNNHWLCKNSISNNSAKYIGIFWDYWTLYNKRNTKLSITNRKCPKCGGNLIERTGRYGAFMYVGRSIPPDSGIWPPATPCVAGFGLRQLRALRDLASGNSVHCGIWPPAFPFRSPRGRFQESVQDEGRAAKLLFLFLYLSTPWK